MFYVQSPLKREFFVELLDGTTLDDVTFKFVEMKGMKIYFDYEGDVDVERAIRIAKDHIKTTDLATVLYYIVMPA